MQAGNSTSGGIRLVKIEFGLLGLVYHGVHHVIPS